jgi:hypothetical protein
MAAGAAMNQHDIDPSLLPAEPAPERLDDGFSPPAVEMPAPDAHREPARAQLSPQSPF